MTSTADGCAAGGKKCGTRDGWRRGGRCPRCRQAHNEDCRQRRWKRSRPSDEVVAAFGAQLRAGVDLPVAARAVGIHPTTGHLLVRREPALRDEFATPAGPALRDESAAPTDPPDEQTGRQNAYLTQLLAHRGAFKRAVAAAGVSHSTVQLWRANDPLFRAADEALRALAKRQAENASYRIGGSLDVFLEGLREGLTYAAASARAGVTLAVVRSRMQRDPDFEARVREIRPKGAQAAGRRRGGPRKPINEDRLRAFWASKLTVAQIAEFFDVSTQTVYTRAAELELGSRRQARL